MNIRTLLLTGVFFVGAPFAHAMEGAGVPDIKDLERLVLDDEEAGQSPLAAEAADKRTERELGTEQAFDDYKAYSPLRDALEDTGLRERDARDVANGVLDLCVRKHADGKERASVVKVPAAPAIDTTELAALYQILDGTIARQSAHLRKTADAMLAAMGRNARANS